MTYSYRYIVGKKSTTLWVFPQRSIHPIWEATYPSFQNVAGTDILIIEKTLVDHGIMGSWSDVEGLKNHLTKIGIIKEGDSIKKH